MLEQFLMKYFWHSCTSRWTSSDSLLLSFSSHSGGMVFIAIPFLTYDGPAETDGNFETSDDSTAFIFDTDMLQIRWEIL